MSFAGANVHLLLVGELWAAVTGTALARFCDRLAVLVFRPLEDRLAALLCRSQFAIGQTVAVGTIGQRVDKRDQVGELLLVKTLRAKKEFFCARTAFGRHVRITAVPLEGFGPSEIFQRTIVDDIFAEAVRLQIPLQSVNGRVEVAIGAAELPLECKAGGEKQPLAATEGVHGLRAAEIDR